LLPPNGPAYKHAGFKPQCAFGLSSGVEERRPMSTLQSAAQNQLRQFVEQIENLEEQKKALSDDIRDKFLEAKSVGFDVKALRQIVRLRKKTRDQRQEEESILEVYMHALGMILDDMPNAPSHIAGEMLDAAE
jgi:uncharacterized protein (UPF0335 family)